MYRAAALSLTLGPRRVQRGKTLATKLYATFPWLKIVIFMREPIARAISYTRMHTRERLALLASAPACGGGGGLTAHPFH
jgi:hypothetical protein